jgi:hypothetical protein
MKQREPQKEMERPVLGRWLKNTGLIRIINESSSRRRIHL